MKLTTLSSLFLTVVIGFALRLDAQQVMHSNNNIPISERLNPDGSLKTDDGFSGSLSVTDYEMTYDSHASASKFFAKGNPPKAQTITWSSLGNGTSYTVNAIAVSGGNAYVGGDFMTAGGVYTYFIAKWNGSSWSALGSGMNSYVNAIAASGSDIYAGGSFTLAGGVYAPSIGKWNGSSWSALGDGTNASVFAIGVSGSNVYVGGTFTIAGVSSANRIAKWNGSSWSALGSGMNNTVNAIAVSGSDVYVGGLFTTAGGNPANYIAKWNGSSWSALGTGMNATVSAIAVSGSNVYAGGSFTTAGGNTANYIAKWDGSSWSALGSGMNAPVNVITVSGSDVYAGGEFTTAGGTSVNRIAKWNGSSWSALGGGTNSYVRALAVDISAGKMIVGGQFTTVDGSISANYVASFTDSENPLPVELTSFNATLNAKRVHLRWQTATEINNYGFNIERRVELKTDEWETIGFVSGHGSSNIPHSYSFSDHSTFQSGKYFYRLKQLDRDGSHEYSKVVEVEIGFPLTMSLSQNFPNPFSQRTAISFSLPVALKISLRVFDVLGREVRVLQQGSVEAGMHSISFEKIESGKAMPLAKGVYYYTLSTGEQYITRKMLLMD